MIGQYLEKRADNSSILERTDQDIYNPVVDSDLHVDKVPVDEVLFPEEPENDALAASITPKDEVAVQIALQSESITHEAATISANVGSLAALLDREVSEHFRTRWNEIQGKFVDEPRSSVQEADALVSEVVKQITQMFATEHSALESQWNQGNDVSTEDLRNALRRYRSFFNRLVV